MTVTAYSEKIMDILRTHESESEDPDQLFYSAYLMGHISLLAGDDYDSTEAFDHQLQQSLAHAFTTENLTTEDKEGIKALLSETKTAAAA